MESPGELFSKPVSALGDFHSAGEPSGSPLAATPYRRYQSVDALRGLDMLCIIGLDTLFSSLAKAWPDAATIFLKMQMHHSAWIGLRFYDLIFPLFIFLVGVSLAFSFSKMQAQRGFRGTLWRILRRGAVLYLLGILMYGGLSMGISGVRLCGVLQRIAICYVVAALLLLAGLRVRGLIVVSVAILLGYWALLSFVPVPGFGAGNFAHGANWADYLDAHFLPLHKWDGKYDPEGMLSTLPAIVTCLLGVLAGWLLAAKRLSDLEKVRWLALLGVAGVVVGAFWSAQFPEIKKIWTSSFVLSTAGWSCLLLAAFHQVIEVWNFRRWTTPLLWVGMNPITLYLIAGFVNFRVLAAYVVGYEKMSVFGVWQPVAAIVLTLFLLLALARFLYQRKIFLRL